MPQQETQPLQGQLSENDLAALLGYMTTLNQHAEGQHPDQQVRQPQGEPQDGPTSPETAPGDAQPPEPQNTPDPRIDALETQFNALKTEVAKTIKDEIGQVKEMVQKAVEDDTKEDGKE